MTETNSPAKYLYDSLSNFSDLQRLIDDGESEGQYLECKTNGGSQVPAGTKAQFSKAVSAFSNSGGGVIVWGVSTINQTHTGLDILTQIEPIGNIKNFQKQLNLSLHSLMEPQIRGYESKIILENKNDTRGVLISYVPPVDGDPVRVLADGKFWIRSGSVSSPMSYEMIKRMFAGANGPDIEVHFDERLIEINKTDNSWTIPIILSNKSSAVAKDVEISVTIINDDACSHISGQNFQDQSALNPGKKILMGASQKSIYKGKDIMVGKLNIKMKIKEVRLTRKLSLGINIFCSEMRAKSYSVTILLTQKGFVLKDMKAGYLY